MVYELRTYWAAPGKAEALHQRFRTLTLGIFERYDMQVVGFWTPNPATEATGDLVYLLVFPSQEALASAWASFHSDPDWLAGFSDGAPLDFGFDLFPAALASGRELRAHRLSAPVLDVGTPADLERARTLGLPQVPPQD